MFEFLRNALGQFLRYEPKGVGSQWREIRTGRFAEAPFLYKHILSHTFTDGHGHKMQLTIVTYTEEEDEIDSEMLSETLLAQEKRYGWGQKDPDYGYSVTEVLFKKKLEGRMWPEFEVK